MGGAYRRRQLDAACRSSFRLGRRAAQPAGDPPRHRDCRTRDYRADLRRHLADFGAQPQYRRTESAGTQPHRAVATFQPCHGSLQYRHLGGDGQQQQSLLGQPRRRAARQAGGQRRQSSLRLARIDLSARSDGGRDTFHQLRLQQHALQRDLSRPVAGRHAAIPEVRGRELSQRRRHPAHHRYRLGRHRRRGDDADAAQRQGKYRHQECRAGAGAR